MADTVIQNGESSDGLPVNDGDTLHVESGGSATNTTVSRGGIETVESGGTDSHATVFNGGEQDVFGSADITDVAGKQVIESGGTFTNSLAVTTVESGGEQDVFGSANFTIVAIGGTQVVESGGSATTTIDNGGLVVVSAGGFTGNAGVNAGGDQDVFGSASGSVIGFGGTQIIEFGGSATNDSISSGGLEVVSVGGHDNGAHVRAGGILEVNKGGIVTNADVSSGGVYEVAGRGSIVTPPAVDPTIAFESGSFLGIGPGTTLTGYTISNEVNLAAGDGGTVKSTTVGSGTVLELLFSGTASNTHVASGGTEIVESGGFDVSATVSAGGKLVVVSGGQAFQTHILFGGTYEVSGGATVDPAVTVDSGGIIEFGSGSTPVGVTAPSGVTLEIGDGLILNLGLGDTVSGLVVVDGGHLHISGGSATATVVNGGDVIVDSGGSATGTLVHNGLEVISAAGTETGATVDGFGELEIAGTATNVTVKGGGGVFVDSGGSLSGGIFEDGASLLVVSAGGSATGVTLNVGFADVFGTLNSATTSVEVDIESGGFANETDVESGGDLLLRAGASASGTTVHSGGELVNEGGTDTATHVLSGGTLRIQSGIDVSTPLTGSSLSTVIEGGGSATVDSGGVIDSATLSGTSVGHGGSAVFTSAFLTVGNGGSATGTTIDIGKEVVFGGGSDDSATINSGGTQDVDGGSASNATINSGGVQVVEEGGSATATTVNDHGEQDVSDDGAAFGTQINSGGIEVVFDGGTDTSASVSSGGKQIVNGGGSATGVTVGVGGEQDITDGGEASDTTISGSGLQVVSAGGSAVDTTVNGGGQVTVEFGGVASGTTINFGQLVLSGSHFGPATAIDTTVGDGGTLSVLAFGVTSNATVFASGLEVVSAGGTAVGTTLSGGQEDVWGSASGTQITEGPFSARGTQVVESGGVADHSHVDHGTLQVNAQGAAIEAFVGSDGLEIVQHGGFDSSTVVVGAQNVFGIAVNTLISGGTQTVDSGGFASGATFSGGGLEVVSNGGSAVDTFVFDGGEMRVDSGGFASGAIVGGLGSADVESGGQIVDLHLHSGGHALVESGGTISGTTTISGGGTLEIQSGAITSGTAHVVFTGGGKLILDEARPDQFENGVIVGAFPEQDLIDLKGVVSAAGMTVSGSTFNHDIEVSSGGSTTYKIAIDPTVNLDDYQVSLGLDSDGSSTDVVITPILSVASAGFSAPSEALHAGQKVTFTVQMNEDSTVSGGGLKVTGTPALLLNDGGKATYVASASHLATGTLVFSYTVGAHDNVDDLKVTGISLGSGNSIQDAAHHNAVMGGGFIDTGVRIDTIAPAVGSATTTEPVFNNAMRAGSTVSIEFKVIGGESLLVSGAPKLTLSNGGTATYDAGASHLEDGELVFDYTAKAGQDTKAGIPLSVTSLSLNGGSIKDLAGNALVVASVAGKSTGLTVDTHAPVVKVSLKSDAGLSATDKITNNPTVTGTADPNATVNIFDGATFLSTATTDSKGNFTFTPTGLANGQHTITVTDTDIASNFGLATINFTLDKASPTITSYAHQGAALTNAATVQYDIKFSETVTGVTASDFSVVVDSGNITTASIKSVTAVAGSNGTEYIVTANTGKGDGTLEVDLHGAPVHDIAGNGVSTPTTVPFNHAVLTASSSVGEFSAAATADFNGDGKADLVVGLGDIAVMLGKGDGTFLTPSPVASSLGFVSDIAVGDFNGDGKADFVAADFDSSDLLVRLGNGKGAFTAAASPTVGSQPSGIATGDFNGDGKLDIAVTNENAGTVSVLLGNGDGTFQTQSTFAAGGAASSLAVADLNHDGHADIVVTNAGYKTVSVLLGDGIGGFAPQQTFAVGRDPEGVAIGDLDGNGKLDLVVTNDDDNTVSVLLGDGAGGFQAQQTFAAGPTPFTVRLADVNADGVLDIIESSSNNDAVGVLLGNGDGTFQNVVEFSLGSLVRAVVTGDFNGDGRPDFVTNDGNGVATYLNEPTAAGDILTIDKTPPTVTGATSPTAATTRLPLSGTMEIDVATSENVIVTNGAGLTLKLSDNGIATYDAAHSTATKLAFDYTVAAGQNSLDLRTTALVLGKGTTVTDGAGNALNIAGAVNNDLGVIVDTNAPTVSHVTVSSTGASNKALLDSDTLTITLTLTDATAGDQLHPLGTPTLTLSDGGTATFDHASGNTVVFNYTVGSESTTDLRLVKFNFDPSNTITDQAGNPATIPSSMADLKLTANVYTFTHKNGGDFDFDRAANWTPAQVPTHGNTALLTTAGTVTTSTDNTIRVLSVANGVTLDIEGHQFTIAGNGPVNSTSVNAGTITVGDGSDLEFFNTAINNTGVINLKSTGDDTTLDILLSVALSGKGTITLGDNAHNIIEDFAAGTLTNVDNTISGAGVIGNETNLSLINQAKGIINATSATNALIINGHGDSHDSTGDPLDNAGLMEATGAGGLIIDLGTESGSGIVNNTGGTFLASGAHAHVDFHDADITGGTFKTTGATAAINVFGQSSINGVANTGTLNVTDGTTLALRGAVFNNTGTVNINGTGDPTLLEINDSLSLQGGGKVILTGSGSAIVNDTFDPVTLTNVDNTISGVGTIGDGHITINNGVKGTINANAATALNIDVPTLVNHGTLEATNSGGLIIQAGAITNTATITAADPSRAAYVQFVGGTITDTGGTLFANGANTHIDLQGVALTDGTLKTAGAHAAVNVTSSSSFTGVTNTGTLNIADHQTLTVLGTTLNNTMTGVININDVMPTALKIGNGGTFTLHGGGKVNLNGNGASEIVSDGTDAVTFVNADNAIAGTGIIGDSHMTLNNQSKGVINGSDATNSLAISATGGPMTNAGTLEGTKAGGLDIMSSVTNSNLITAVGVGAKVVLDSDTVTNTATGKIAASGSGAHVDINAATILGGTLSTTAGGAINVSNMSAFDGRTGHALTSAAAVQVKQGGELDLFGSITNTGTITIGEHTATVTLLAIDADTILAGAGHIVLAGDTSADAEVLINTGTLTNMANTFSGTGQFGFGIVHNAAGGTIIALAGDDLVINTTTIDNDGKLSASGSGHLHLDNATIHNSATGVESTTTAGATLDLVGTDIDHGSVSIIAGSSLEASGNDSTITASKVTNAGTMDLLSTDLTVSGSTFTNSGTISADDSILTINGNITNSGALVAKDHGSIVVTGTVSGGTALLGGTTAGSDDQGIIEFGGASAAKVTFGAGGDGTLMLDAATTTAAKFTGNITGFDLGDNIDLGALTNDPVNAGLSYHATGVHAGTLTVDDHGGHIIALNFIGDYTLASFQIDHAVTTHVDLLHV